MSCLILQFIKHFQCNFTFLRKEDEIYLEWVAKVDEIAKANLEKPLLLRDEATLQISVNFDPQVRNVTIAMYILRITSAMMHVSWWLCSVK